MISKLVLINTHTVPEVKSLRLQMGIGQIKKVADMRILKTLVLIENMVGQKPTLRRRLLKYTFVNRGFSFLSYVLLRRKKLGDFFQNLIYMVLPRVRKRYLTISNGLKEEGGVFFSLKNVNVFPNLEEGYFKWPYNVELEIPQVSINSFRHPQKLQVLYLRYVNVPIKG